MDISKTIEAAKQLDINSAWLSIYCFVSIVAPGVLVIFYLKPDYIESLTTPKLLLLSLSILSPVLIISFLCTLFNSYTCHQKYSSPDTVDFLSVLVKTSSKFELFASITVCSIFSYVSTAIMVMFEQPSLKVYYGACTFFFMWIMIDFIYYRYRPK